MLNRLKYCIAFIGALFAFVSEGLTQEWNPFIPFDHPVSVPQAFHPETVKERILKDQPSAKTDLYQQFTQDISGIATWNILKGETYDGLEEWRSFLNARIEQFVLDHGDTMTYHLQILRDPSINAYATAGGYVFMHVGLLAEARNMEEVVLVLAHELGHNFNQHAWQGYLDRHRASNTIMVASFIGGMAGLIGKTAAISSYMSHSREDEGEADKIAIQLLSRAQIDLSKGAGIYRTFMSQQVNQELRYGSASRHWFYGSTHPAPAERYARLMAIEQSVRTPVEQENFKAIRKRARLERLHLLMANGDYRTAIESAWRYLIDEPKDDAYERMMFDALRRLQMTQTIPTDALVLAYDYNIKSSVVDELRSSSPPSASAKEAMAAILMLDEVDPSTQPFPLGCSFGALNKGLSSRLEMHQNPEAKLLLAIAEDDIDEKGIAAYIAAGGERSEYAQWILQRSEGGASDSAKCIMMPSSLSIPGSDLMYGKDYEDFMDYYDWNPIIRRFKWYGYNVEVIRKDQVSGQTPYTWEMLERLEALSNKQVASKAFDAARLDPDLGEFMMERNIGSFIGLHVGLAKKFIRCDLQVLDFTDPQKPSWQSSNGICLGNANSRGYLASQVLKRHDKLKP
jgi:hypothetical protein